VSCNVLCHPEGIPNTDRKCRRMCIVSVVIIGKCEPLVTVDASPQGSFRNGWMM